MAYIALIPLAAQVGQYAFSRITKRIETEESTFAAQVPKAPSIDEIRARYGAPNAPTAPNLSTIRSQMPHKPVLGALERPTPPNEQSIVRETFRGTETTTSASVLASSSYAAEFDTSVACLPCTRGHLSAMAVAAEAAAQAADRGDDATARKNLARLAGEAVVMERFDWTPEKMAKATPEDRAIIERVIPQVHELVAATPTAPVEVVGAWSAVDESLRFARSSRPTAEDHAEIHARVSDAEDLANYAEREVLSPSGAAQLSAEQRRTAREALQHMRTARHTLTDADALDLPTLEAISTEFEQATVLLTPTPAPEQAKEIAARARAVRRSLDDAIRAKMQAQMQRARAV